MRPRAGPDGGVVDIGMVTLLLPPLSSPHEAVSTEWPRCAGRDQTYLTCEIICRGDAH
jgi:hypothetical protein